MWGNPGDADESQLQTVHQFISCLILALLHDCLFPHSPNCASWKHLHNKVLYLNLCLRFYSGKNDNLTLTEQYILQKIR